MYKYAATRLAQPAIDVLNTDDINKQLQLVLVVALVVLAIVIVFKAFKGKLSAAATIVVIVLIALIPLGLAQAGGSAIMAFAGTIAKTVFKVGG